MKTRYKVVAGVAVLATVAGSAVANSVLTKPEYIKAMTSAASIKALAYAGDQITGLTIEGIPDGMGAYRNEDGTIELLQIGLIDRILAALNLKDDDVAIKLEPASKEPLGKDEHGPP